MLVIRNEQLRALSEARRTNFEVAMLRYLRSFKQGAASTDEELLSIVRDGMMQAKRFGVSARGDVSRFIPYLLTHGRDFPSKPWAAAILKSSANGAQKMDLIDEYDLFSSRGGLIQR